MLLNKTCQCLRLYGIIRRKFREKKDEYNWYHRRFEKTDLESSQDFDGTREFAEESLNEEIKEELIDTVFDITGNEVNSSEVLEKLEELNDEEKALEHIDNIDDYEKEYIGEELKNKLFEDLIDSSIAPESESGEIP